MKVLAIGASRNIGYLSSLRLLKQGAVVTFVVRNAGVFDADENIRPYVRSRHARIVKGDALNEEDIRKAWTTANDPAADVAGAAEGIDLVLFTIGGTPKFKVNQGFVIDPPNICTQATICLLRVLASPPTPTNDLPKLVVISSTGLGNTAHSALPLLLRPVYSYLLDAPHTDKLGMERLLGYVANWTWPEKDGEPEEHILARGWQQREEIGTQGSLQGKIVVIRPALLTDGECKADKPKGKKEPYRAKDEEFSGSYTISRADVAHFISEEVIRNWNSWEGKCVRIAY